MEETVAMKLESYEVLEALRARDLYRAIRLLVKQYNLESRESEILAYYKDSGLNFAAGCGVAIYFKGPSFVAWSDDNGFEMEQHNPKLGLSVAPLRGIRYQFPTASRR